MNVEYLKRNVGEALARGISATVIEQPEDPVEYLGMWLMQYRKNEQHQQGLETVYQALERERLAHEQQLEFKRQEKLAAEREVAAKLSEEERIVYDMDHAEERDLLEIEDLTTYEKSHPPLWDKVLGLLQQRLGLANAYIGLVELDQVAMDAQLPPVKDDDEEADAAEGDAPPAEEVKVEIKEEKHLRYAAATEENKWMLGKSLKQVPEGTADDNKNLKAAGLTYDALAFKYKEPGEEDPAEGEDPPAVDPADEEEEEGEKKPELEFSGRTLYVKNVVEEARVKFFGQPQIGSLVIVPIKDARQELKGVITMDTLGKGFHDDFSSEQLKLAEELAVSLGINMERLSKARDEKIEADRCGAEEENDSMFVSYEEVILKEEKELEAPSDEAEEIMKQSKADTVMGNVKAYLAGESEGFKAEDCERKFMELKTSAGTDDAVTKVCQSLFFLLGRSKKEVSKWDQIRRIVTVDLVSTLDQFEAGVDKNATDFNRAERALRDIDMEAVKTTSFAAVLIYRFVKAAVELYMSNVSLKAYNEAQEKLRIEEEEEAARQAAAEAEAEGEEDDA